MYDPYQIATLASLIIWFVLAIPFTIWAIIIVKRKGYSRWFGFLLGFVFGIIGIVIAYVLPQKYDPNYNYQNYNPQPTNSKGTKTNQKTIFIVHNIQFQSYDEARQYCLDRNINLNAIQAVNK